MVIERDPQPYRGTAGLLRDAVADYQADDYVLMINAAQIPLAPLSQVFQRLCQTRADVAVASNRDGTPSGHMLVRCGVMEKVAASGFVDMKEQVLEQLAKTFAIGVADFDQPPGLPIRSRARYLAALRAWYRVENGRQPVQGPFEEDWHAEFGFAEPGAQVDDSAVLHDSVVLEGGSVEAGAVVIRSVVCRGAVIRRKQTVTEQLLADPARAKEASESA
jgi:ADP-glucose pyrophosphorylase